MIFRLSDNNSLLYTYTLLPGGIAVGELLLEVGEDLANHGLGLLDLLGLRLGLGPWKVS